MKPTSPAHFIAVLAAAVLLVACGPVASQQCPTLIWADEFDGNAVDDSRWSLQLGDGCAEGICGWGNNEEQTYQADNATVSNGTLKITARQQRVRNKKFTSARLRSLGKGEWTFGRFEARIKLPIGQGIWPAFWMLPTDEVFGGWPQSGEIDIMENVGHEADTVFGTMHFGDPWPDNQFSGANFRLFSGQFADNFHTFAIEKEPGLIRWLIDDVTYSTKTTGDTDPFVWPFDERFHFLLNVAVGGNLPGSPDATTVFPQMMEVDYVRVYDGNRAHLSGDRTVGYQAAGVTYTVANPPGGSTFNWVVPAGATITSGQGGASIVVNWGDTGGPVVVDIAGDCGSRQLAIEVLVEPPFSFDFTFENFDEQASVSLTTATGTLVEITNPDSTGINPSALSGEYTRSGSEQFDVLAYTTTAIGDAAEYVDNVRKFSIDLYSTAPVGTTLLLQLEDSGAATPSNYPTGRHSRYQAQTTVQNSWERIELPFLDRPDGSTNDAAVDTMILLFAPNRQTADVYVWDNLDSYTSLTDDTPVSLHVADIVVGTQSAGRGTKHGVATVSLIDNLGNAVDAASITGDFSGTFNETVSATTGPNGSATLVTGATAKGSVSFEFCVSAIVHASLGYDAAMNTQTCVSL